MEEQLPKSQFIRIHNSYIVALKAIDVIHKNEVQIGKFTLPVSDSYKQDFRKMVEESGLG
jgi:DNA-binding LytR/AlgR family response regulator